MSWLGMLRCRRVDELVGHAVFVGFPQLAMLCWLDRCPVFDCCQ